MDNAIISDKLTDLLKNRKVKAAIFTTYTFEIDFFELEVIPLLLNNDTPYSTDERVKRVQVRVDLQKAKTQIPLPLEALEVFYDGKLFRNQAHESPRMEYLCHGVDLGDSAFHAKVAFILVYDKYHGSDCLLVGAGSNNLSYAGWWENIECQHWEEVWGSDWGDERNLQEDFLRQLREDIKYLQKKRRSGLDEKSDALGKISDFLNDECTGQRGIGKTFAYYGLNPKARFQPFLKKSAKDLLFKWYQRWNLEIISPFFAKDAENKEHEFFFELGVQEILLLLPKSQDGKALCESEYYDHIKGEEWIHWAEWKPAIEKKLGVTARLWRRLHAKIYHFYNGKQSWIFVGSVNFTHKAMGDNVEAGFFTKLEKAGSLLEYLNEDPAGFDAPKETIPGDEHEDENPVPQIYLAYDWTKKELRGQIGELEEDFCIINIHLPEGGDRYAIGGWKINNKECCYEGNTEALENLLKNGALVKVSGKWQSENRCFPEHLVLLQETGWIHKPLDLAHLSVQEILQLYADMNREGLMKAIEDAKTRELVLKGTAGELPKTDDGPETQQFFCDYAKVFHAFGELKKRLSGSGEENGNSKQIEYYLTGNAPDSLPTLIQLAKLPRTSEIKEGEKSNKDNNDRDPVLSYLSLLCCKEIYAEIYEDDKSSKRAFLAKEQLKIVQEQLEKVDKYIDECKSKIVLEEDNTSDRRERFLRWFEEQFFKEYKLAESKNEAGTA